MTSESATTTNETETKLPEGTYFNFMTGEVEGKIPEANTKTLHFILGKHTNIGSNIQAQNWIKALNKAKELGFIQISMIVHIHKNFSGLFSDSPNLIIKKYDKYPSKGSIELKDSINAEVKYFSKIPTYLKSLQLSDEQKEQIGFELPFKKHVGEPTCDESLIPGVEPIVFFEKEKIQTDYLDEEEREKIQNDVNRTIMAYLNGKIEHYLGKEEAKKELKKDEELEKYINTENKRIKDLFSKTCKDIRIWFDKEENKIQAEGKRKEKIASAIEEEGKSKRKLKNKITYHIRRKKKKIENRLNEPEKRELSDLASKIKQAKVWIANAKLSIYRDVVEKYDQLKTIILELHNQKRVTR